MCRLELESHLKRNRKKNAVLKIMKKYRLKQQKYIFTYQIGKTLLKRDNA